MPVRILELLYAGSTLVFVISGLVMVGMAVRAYRQTSRRAMLFLSVGFALAVVGAATAMVSAFLTNFEATRSLLLVDSGLTTVGFVFVIYSLVIYE